MRARIHWLALVPVLCIAGCRGVPPPPPQAGGAVFLPEEDARRAEAMAHYSQALISELTLGESQSSVRHFQEAASCDPSFLALSLKVAADAIGRRDYTGAVAVLERAEPFHPRSVELKLLRGICYQATGDTPGAARVFRQAIGADPTRSEGYVRLATLEVVGLAPRKALAVVAEGCTHAADPAPLLDFCATVARICLAGKDTAEAARFLEPVVQHGKGREADGELLGQCYAALNRHRDACRVFESLLKANPANRGAAVMLGESRERMGDRAGACAAYRQGCQGPAPDPVAALRLANLQMERDPEAALATLRQALAQTPGDLRLHVFLALVCMRLERFEAAVEQFDAVSRTLESNETMARAMQPLFYFWYGQACERAGRVEDAERHLQRYLEARPEDHEALNYLAYLWAEQGRNLDLALSFVDRALKAEPDNGAYLDTRGWIYFKKGDYPRAVEDLRRALRHEGEDPVICEHLGDAWQASGQTAQAVRMWTKSLKKNPANKALKEKLARAQARPAP